MSLSPLVSFKSRFVTYVLNFPCINYRLDAKIFFIYIISHNMFRAIMLIFRRSRYCIHAAYFTITL